MYQKTKPESFLFLLSVQLGVFDAVGAGSTPVCRVSAHGVGSVLTEAKP